MSNISTVLVNEGIQEADSLDSKLVVVAKSVSEYINMLSESILYELEVVKALESIRQTKNGFLNETDVKNLSKPARNKYYPDYGVKSITLRNAIAYSLKDQHSDNELEIRVVGSPQGSMQQFSSKVLLYKDDQKLKDYICSRTSPSPIVIYNFEIPPEMVGTKNVIVQRCTR
jgi:hypothetical protein